MIIAATTEARGILLETFRRRIPVIIELPPLRDRPLQERLGLIELFTRRESTRLNRPIRLSGRALEVFLSYRCPANIGDLRSDLQLCFAKSHLAALADSSLSGSRQDSPDVQPEASQKSVLEVDIDVIPQKVYSAVEDMDLPSDPQLLRFLSQGLLVEPGQSVSVCCTESDYEVPFDIYGFLQSRLGSYRYAGLSYKELKSRLSSELERYFYSIANSLHKREDVEPISMRVIAPIAWNAAKKTLDAASEALGRRYGRRVHFALALHLQQFLGRMKSGQIIYNPNLDRIKNTFSREFKTVSALVPDLSAWLSVTVPEAEVGFITLFLVQPQTEQGKPHIGIVVAAHGQHTASDIAKTANELLSTRHVMAVDAPLSQDVSEVFRELTRVVSLADQGKGVLILADMGAFLDMAGDITSKTGIQCRVVPYVTTAMVLEAHRLIMAPDATVDTVASGIMRMFATHFSQAASSITPPSAFSGSPRTVEPRGAILSICATGLGSALKIRDILLENVPVARTMDIVAASATQDISYLVQHLGTRLKLVVGSFNPQISGIPFVNTCEILTSEGLRRVSSLLKSTLNSGDSVASVSGHSWRDRLKENLGRFVSHIPANTAAELCDVFLDRLQKEVYRVELSTDVAVRTYLHAACMFDRLARGDALPTPPWGNDLRWKRAEFFNEMYMLLEEVAGLEGLTVSEGEVCYFVSTLPDTMEVV